MENKPSSNLPKHDSEPKATGDHIVVYGDVGPGAAIGKGSVQADYIAGGDITINGAVVNNRGDFATLLKDVKQIISDAKTAGEIADDMAQDMLDSIETAAEAVQSEADPPKKTIIGKLQHVAELIDDAMDTFLGEEGSPARILLRAGPIIALLIKVATRIF